MNYFFSMLLITATDTVYCGTSQVSRVWKSTAHLAGIN